MADKKTWAKENEVLKMWPQAKGELQGFQQYLEAKAGITASQLGMAIQLAEKEYQRLLLLTICEVCEEKSDKILELIYQVSESPTGGKNRRVCSKCASRIREYNSGYFR